MRETQLDFGILGTLRASDDGSELALGPPKQRALLALLLINAGNVVTTDQILDALWDEDGADRTDTLRVHVSRLRSSLEPDRKGRGESSVVLTRGNGYVLDVPRDLIDSGRFEQALEEGRSMVKSDPESAGATLRTALAMWRGSALEDFTYEGFAQAEIERLEELRKQAVEERIEADLNQGRGAELIGELEALVRQDPLRERLTGQLMLALYRGGRQAEALRAYQQLRERLGGELGIEPSRGLRELEESILLQESDLDEASEAGAGPRLTVRGYELREQLRDASDGPVYRAFQPSMGREVAIKILPAGLANDPEFIRGFESQALLAAQIEHPHVVPLYDYWREPDAAYLVMRLMRGGSLEERLRRGPTDGTHAMEMLRQVSSGLAAAHQAGVVHNGIDASVVILDADANAYVSGFGACVTSSPEAVRRDISSLASLARRVLDGGLNRETAAVLDGVDDGAYSSVAAFFEDLSTAVVGTATPVETAPREDNPYKGLRAFAETDADDFFGRERTVHRLLERIGGAGPMVALVGPSGSGKSSVVRAGLLPALRRGGVEGSDRWFITDMAPSTHPFEELETALLRIAVNPPASLLEQLRADERGLKRAAARVLPDDTATLLLVIDQFEELFSLTPSEETRSAFLASLATAATDRSSRLKVVLSMRADFLDQPMRYQQFGELLREYTELIPPMSAEELQESITGPAQAAGATLEPGLAATIIGDVADQPGILPLVQYTLTELYESRDGATLTLHTYREIGGITGALGRKAEELFLALDPGAREVARQMFLRLVTLGEGVEDTRRRVLRSELMDVTHDDSSVESILDDYGSQRLLTFDRDPVSRSPTVEVAHEALIREWPRLRRWVADARDDLREHRRLAAAAVEWRDADRDPEYLLTGSRLAAAESWSSETDLAMTELERSFLDESGETARMVRARGRRRRRTIASIAGAVALVVVALGIWGVSLRSSNQREQAFREVDQLTSNAREVIATDPDLALMLAVEAAEQAQALGTEPIPPTIEAVHDALGQQQLLFQVASQAEALAQPAAVFPTGSRVAVAGPARDITIYDTGTGEAIEKIETPRGAVSDLSLGNNGRVLVASSRVSPEIFVFDLDGAAGPMTIDPGCSPEPGSVEVDATGTLVGVACFGTTGALNKVIRLDDGTTIIEDPIEFPGSIDFGSVLDVDGLNQPDRQYVAFGGVPASVYNLDTLSEVRIDLAGDGNCLAGTFFSCPLIRELYSADVAFSADGATLDVSLAGGIGTASTDPRVSQGVEGWEPISRIETPVDVLQIEYSPDSSSVIRLFEDGTVTVSDLTERRILTSVTADVAARIATSSDGTVIAVSAGGTTRLFRSGLEASRDVATIVTSLEETPAAVLNQDGSLVAAVDQNGRLTVWEVATGREVWRRLLDMDGPFDPLLDKPLAINADGSRLVATGTSGRVAQFDITTGDVLAEVDLAAMFGDDMIVHASAVAVSTTGTVGVGGLGWVAAVSAELDTAEIIDTWSTGIGLTDDTWQARFLPDGETLMITGHNRLPRAWNVTTGEPVFLNATSDGYGFDTIENGGVLVLHADTFLSGTDLNDECPPLDRVECDDPFNYDFRFDPPRGVGSAVAASPDGELIAAGFADSLLILNDEFERLYTLTGHQGSIASVAWSGDGRYLVTSGEDSTIRVYAIDTDTLLDLARARIGRQMTDQECLQYLGPDRCDPTA